MRRVSNENNEFLCAARLPELVVGVRELFLNQLRADLVFVVPTNGLMYLYSHNTVFAEQYNPEEEEEDEKVNSNQKTCNRVTN